MSRTPKIPVSGDVLRWAREQRGLPLEVAAKRIGISVERLESFEAGADMPSVAQLKQMVDQYKRPLIVLLLDEPPTTFTPLHDFRLLPDEQIGAYSPDLRDELRRAQLQQQVMRELKAELGEPLERPKLPEPTSDIDEFASSVRKLLGIIYSEQRNWIQGRVALSQWKIRVENIGILVLEASKVPMKEMRGFSLSEQLPFTIVLNGLDSDRGKIFTLLHELTHICIREPGVCDTHQRARSSSDVEVFCNGVAGEALLPTQVLVSLPTVREHQSGIPWTDEELEAIQAVAGGASQEAILRRLLQVDLASRTEYEARRDEFLERYEEWRKARGRGKAGGPPPHRIQLRDRGRPFVRSVFDAYGDGLVTLAEVVDLVGVRTKHLANLQREAFQ